MKSENSNATLARLSYGLTIFLGVCLMFFQIALLAGYLLTFAITKFPVKQQCVVYCLLMAASVALLNVPPASGWSASATMHPVQNLLLLLTVHLAVPCTLLATVSGLMQSFYENQK